MVEGSLWVYGQTDLKDFYRGALTLRQLWVRICSLPAEAPLSRLLDAEAEAAAEKAAQRKQVEDIDAALAPFKRKG